MVGNAEEILLLSRIVERAAPGLDGLGEETVLVVDAAEFEVGDADRVADDGLLQLLDLSVLLLHLLLILLIEGPVKA